MQRFVVGGEKEKCNTKEPNLATAMRKFIFFELYAFIILTSKVNSVGNPWRKIPIWDIHENHERLFSNETMLHYFW